MQLIHFFTPPAFWQCAIDWFPFEQARWVEFLVGVLDSVWVYIRLFATTTSWTFTTGNRNAKTRNDNDNKQNKDKSNCSFDIWRISLPLISLASLGLNPVFVARYVLSYPLVIWSIARIMLGGTHYNGSLNFRFSQEFSGRTVFKRLRGLSFIFGRIIEF